MDNLCKDIFLRSKMDDQGFIPISVIANFNRVRMLTEDRTVILDALQKSSVVELQGDKVRRRHGWVNWLLPTNSRPSTPAPLTSALVVQGEEVHKSFAEMEVQTPAIKSAIDNGPSMAESIVVALHSNGHSSTSRPSAEQTSVALEHYTSAAEESDERVMLAKAEEAERTGQSQTCADTHFIQDSCPEDAATSVGHAVLSSTLQPMHGPLDFQDAIHNAMEDIEEVKDAGQQRSSRASGEEFSSASIVNTSDGHSAELAGVNTETADDGDWLTVSLYNSKRQGSNNKRVTASCLDERKPGGLSAAFKANGSPDEHLLQLGEEYESSRHSMPKGPSLITKRFITPHNHFFIDNARD